MSYMFCVYDVIYTVTNKNSITLFSTITLTLLGRCLYHCKDCWVISVLPDVAMGILCIGDIWSKELRKNTKTYEFTNF